MTTRSAFLTRAHSQYLNICLEVPPTSIRFPHSKTSRTTLNPKFFFLIPSRLFLSGPMIRSLCACSFPLKTPTLPPLLKPLSSLICLIPFFFVRYRAVASWLFAPFPSAGVHFLFTAPRCLAPPSSPARFRPPFLSLPRSLALMDLEDRTLLQRISDVSGSFSSTTAPQ